MAEIAHAFDASGKIGGAGMVPPQPNKAALAGNQGLTITTAKES